MPTLKRPLASRPNGATAFREALGEYIKDLREKKNMTQVQLAREMGFNYPSAVSAIEVGRNSVPPERYLQLAEALGVPPVEFGKNVLKLSDPWMYALLFEKNPKQATERVNELMATRFGIAKSLTSA